MEDLILELKGKIINDLGLEDITPDEIEDDAPLFGEGLGLDSLDALEIVIMLEEDYGLRLDDVEQAREILSSINSLASFIQDAKK